MSGNKNKIFYVTHKTELLIWLLIVLFFVFIHSVTSIYKEKNDENDYHIFLQDVDGLIVGSSVRMMGVEVGHVVKIKPAKDEMYVKFILTNPDVYIPQGTVATVEFSGMAGSKSLELYLPDEKTYIDKSTPLLKTEPPKRLHDSFKLLNDMYNTLTNIINTSSNFSKEIDVNIVEPQKGNQQNLSSEEFLKYSDKFLDNSNKKAVEFRNNIRKLGKNDK